ncbi:hypothetical protein AC17_5013 [Escherichia coli 2-210-07_S3_C2]|nr:hypothetical protein AC17_5013 [Escherichia coli 2-210-07_S3_C2]
MFWPLASILIRSKEFRRQRLTLFNVGSLTAATCHGLGDCYNPETYIFCKIIVLTRFANFFQQGNQLAHHEAV